MIHLTYAEYQCCHHQHLLRVENTREIEDYGKWLVQNENITIENWLDFSQQVCQWGGKTGSRVFGQIKKNNPEIVKSSFEEVKSLLKDDLISVHEVFNALKPINGLGSYSYASKHLRFLAPKRFPVFDSLIKKELQEKHPRRLDRVLIETYFNICTQMAAELNNNNIRIGDDIIDCHELDKKVIDDNKQWTPADVDMAHFAAIKKWCHINSNTDSKPLNCIVHSDNVLPTNINREAMSNQNSPNLTS